MHTKSELNPWWKYEFAEKERVVAVEIYDRLEVCCQDLLSNANVFLIHGGDLILCGSIGKMTGMVKKNVTCNQEILPADGIQIQKTNKDSLVLCEIDVYVNKIV